MSLTAHEIVLRPIISEKSMDEAQRFKYTFAVHDDANKIQIKAAVEELFKVTVISVNVSTMADAKKVLQRREFEIKWLPNGQVPAVTFAPTQ